MGCNEVSPGPNDIVDSLDAEEVADEARERPEVRRWISRFRRLLKDMPPGLEVFVGESVAVMAQGPEGEHFMTATGCKDPSAVIESFNDRRWDGGGW